MRSRRKAAAAALALLSLGLGHWALAAEAKPRTYEITIDRTSYAPTTVYVNLGDTVVWTNEDLFAHTVTSEQGGFDSKDIARGASWRFTPTQRGRFEYLCVYHGSMRGTLVVR